MRQHTQKEKTKVRKSGQSGLRKVKELGQKAKILTALFFFAPIAGDFSVGGHIPDGETIPDFNLLVHTIYFARWLITNRALVAIVHIHFPIFAMIS
ncbi:hypothetical protein B0J13DRAFT_271821 [Dactylonectria estremocensis]|uniref:Uncharacterized protein n=1 Tax=Dactylonectria estremocensis TaxID=1079267 RepID=A0A9P9D2S7_9HYPO|nr:hypothetical protein B0J13DRAFT_271821 [Dactylonectria estremocensis]